MSEAPLNSQLSCHMEPHGVTVWCTFEKRREWLLDLCAQIIKVEKSQYFLTVGTNLATAQEAWRRVHRMRETAGGRILSTKPTLTPWGAMTFGKSFWKGCHYLKVHFCYIYKHQVEKMSWNKFVTVT